MVYWAPIPQSPKRFSQLWPLHTGVHITMYCLGSTVDRAFRFPIFLYCFFSFTWALCQQSQLPETNAVNSAGKALSWLCCSRLMPLDQSLLHSSSQPSPRLGTFPFLKHLLPGLLTKQTYFAWPNVEKTTKSIGRGWFCCKAGKLWWSVFHTYSFGFLKYISFQGWLYMLSAVTPHKEYIKLNYWQQYLAPSINCRILDENEWQLCNCMEKKF